MKIFVILALFCIINSYLLRFKQTTQEHFLSLNQFNLSSTGLEVNLLQKSENAKEALLTARKSKNPEQSSTSSEIWSVKADVFDKDSWISNSPNHTLQLEAQQDWKLGIFIYELEKPVEWELKVTTLGNSYEDQHKCLNSCSENGKCIKSRCDCGDFFAGNDCSIPVQDGYLNRVYSFALSAQIYSFFRFDYNFSFECEVNKKAPTLRIFSKEILSGISKVTGRLDYDQRCSLGLNDTNKKCQFSENSILGFFSMENQKINFICSKKSDSNSTQKSPLVMWILLSVACLVIMVWGVIAVLKCCRFKNKRKTLATFKIILKDDKFPVLHYKEMTQKDDDTCSICQVKFEVSSAIRILECRHFYHKDCIDEWFQRQKICCICKKDYNNENYFESSGPIQERVPEQGVLNLA